MMLGCFRSDNDEEVDDDDGRELFRGRQRLASDWDVPAIIQAIQVGIVP